VKATLGALLVGGAVVLATTLVSAEPSIAVVRVDPASCVDRAELSQALAHAGIHDERLTQTDEPTRESVVRGAHAAETSPPPVVVAIDGAPDALRVTLRRGATDATERLAPATCDTATDVVAAFLSSAVGPPPAPRAPVALAELEHALGSALAERKLQLALLDVRMTLARDHWGNVSAHLEHLGAPGCSEDIALGVIDAVTHATVRAASDVLESALTAKNPCLAPRPVSPTPPPPRPANLAELERVHALRNALDRVPRTEIGSALGTLSVVNGITFALLVEQPEFAGDQHAESAGEREARSRALRAYGAGLLIGGGVGVFALPADRRIDFYAATNLAGYGLLTAGSLFGGSEFARKTTAVGFLTSAALASLNFMHPTPLTRLSAERNEVARSGLTKRRAAEIERDLEHADPLVPPWLVLTPVVVGTSLAAIHTFASEPTDSPLLIVDVAAALAFGTVIAVDAAQGSIWGSYERALDKVGLEELALAPGPGPLGVSLVGRF